MVARTHLDSGVIKLHLIINRKDHWDLEFLIKFAEDTCNKFLVFLKIFQQKILNFWPPG